jgi:hypothetical protein
MKGGVSDGHGKRDSAQGSSQGAKGAAGLAAALRQVELPSAPQMLAAPSPAAPKAKDPDVLAEAVTSTTAAAPKSQRKRAAKKQAETPSLFDVQSQPADSSVDLQAKPEAVSSEATDVAHVDTGHPEQPPISNSTVEGSVEPAVTTVAAKPSLVDNVEEQGSSGEVIATATATVVSDPPPAAADVAVAEAVQTASIDLAVIKELCLRARNPLAVSKVAIQLAQVTPEDLSAAEEEVVQAALEFLADESTVEGMDALKVIAKYLSAGPNKETFRAAYNGRVKILTGGNA